eukprot:gene20524-12938_t
MSLVCACLFVPFATWLTVLSAWGVGMLCGPAVCVS